VDELGLTCKACGQCAIDGLQKQARRLGYLTMVAEGSGVVTELLASGKIDAVVGVSCLDMLEKVFPYLEVAAIPGLAIPLLRDGCSDTCVDIDWVEEAIQLRCAAPASRPDAWALRQEVAGWFGPAVLDQVMGAASSQTEQIARDWLLREGKRWRPMLAACAFKSLRPGQSGGDDLRRCCLAVECFHKASLIHDDIEDQDPIRYGQKALHEEFGLAVALNVGDFLLGEGYRLIAACECDSDVRSAMLAAAARGHRALCLGQGEELTWLRQPRPLPSRKVLEIFRLKTSPAFGVALHLGALLAGGDGELCGQLDAYSDALGIAYQIRDDLEDFQGQAAPRQNALKPSVILALAMEKASPADRAVLEECWQGRQPPPQVLARVLENSAALPAGRALLEEHLRQAHLALNGVEPVDLRALLGRMVHLIFTGLPAWDCCNEHNAPDAPTGGQGAGPAA
jgi:geranylgeranyl pyrophosphate synthase